MSLTIALIGRPNVGKSTLFNRITKTKNALVADEPGLTRDRQYGFANFESHSFILVDTGGIGAEEESVDELMSGQSLQALEESDCIFFMLSAKEGCTTVDMELAQKLRQSQKKVFVVINKTDGFDEDIIRADFYQLGFEKLYCIAASHGRGVSSFLTQVFSEISSPKEEGGEIEDSSEQRIKLAIIGRPNVGKSTLVNRLLGEERVVAYDMPGTTRDSIFIPYSKNDQQYTLIDTAGIRRKGKTTERVEKFSVIKALKAIELADVCLILFDAQVGLVEQDLHVIRFAIDAGKGLFLVFNKWDGLDEEQKEQIKSEVHRRLNFVTFAPMAFISAKHGSGVGKLMGEVDNIYKSCRIEMSTSKATKILEEATSKHPPPLVNGRRIKLRFAHVGGHHPPLIVIHGNQTEKVPLQYQRYLINYYREKLKITGTPLRLEFKTSDNPYKDKKNKLTDKQLHKRRRMIRHHKKK